MSCDSFPLCLRGTDVPRVSDSAPIICLLAEWLPRARAGRSTHSKVVVAQSSSDASFVSDIVLVAGCAMVSRTDVGLALHGMHWKWRQAANQETPNVVGIGVRKANRCFEGEHVVREGLERSDFQVKA